MAKQRADGEGTEAHLEALVAELRAAAAKAEAAIQLAAAGDSTAATPKRAARDKAKKGNLEGSIRQRRNGLWEARVSLPDGKRKSVYGQTREDVSKQLTKLQAARDAGRPVVMDERQTVGTFLARWLEDVCRPSVRPNTFEGYEVCVRKHITPRLGKTRLSRLGAQDLAKLYRELRETGLAPRTVQLVHAVLHKALVQALRWDLIARNPADLVDPPRVERKEFTYLTPEQARTLLEKGKDDPLHALYVVALAGGLRIGEALGLKWDDIDWEEGWISIRRQLARVKGEGFTFTEPKTVKGRRNVTLPDAAMDALRRHRTAQLAARLKAGAVWEDNNLVFCSQVGTPLERQNAERRSFKPLLERLELPRIRFHDLRHSSATLLLRLGEHPKVVQERLGHATIGVTLDVYSHVLPAMQREAARKLDGLFGSGDAAVGQ